MHVCYFTVLNKQSIKLERVTLTVNVEKGCWNIFQTCKKKFVCSSTTAAVVAKVNRPPCSLSLFCVITPQNEWKGKSLGIVKAPRTPVSVRNLAKNHRLVVCPRIEKQSSALSELTPGAGIWSFIPFCR